MAWNPEVETDEVTEDELEALGGGRSCDGFAFDYLDAHDDVVVKDAMVDGSLEHCYVYDRELDVTIDATLGQFDGRPSAGAWDGDRHPHLNTTDEVFEWESREAFEEHYARSPECNFVIP